MDSIKMYMDGYFKSNLEIIKNKAIPNNWDCLTIVFGREGTGKTTLSTQLAFYLDPNFTENNIVFTPEQFDSAIDEAEDEASIIWDESITGAMSSQHANNVSQRIISKLTMIRKKKLKIILCFPYLYMLNKYFVSRCLFSIRVYSKGFDKRGYASFYNSMETEQMYDLIKEKYRYNYMQGIMKSKKSFNFRFGSKFIGDEDIYDNNKTVASKLAVEKDDKWKKRFIDACNYIRHDTEGTLKGFSKTTDITAQGISNILNT